MTAQDSWYTINLCLPGNPCCKSDRFTNFTSGWLTQTVTSTHPCLGVLVGAFEANDPDSKPLTSTTRVATRSS